ncbi:hypothetical protein [Hungatella effluvii]|uniref:hypothetical protein n=1 Tax=Hungatella effluvii TaxID=1096246 RepID=UPI0022DFCAB4|nr:hypothetical protein [Hungatella effluvii]
MTLNEPMLLSAVEASPLYAKVNGSWQQLNQDSSGYIMLPSTATQLMYQFKGQCNIRMLVDSADLSRFGNMSFQLMPNSSDSYWVYDTFYNFVDDNGVFYLSSNAPYWGNIYFDYSPASSVQIKFNTYTSPSENLKINGVYDSGDKPFMTKTVSAYASLSVYPRFVAYKNNEYSFWKFPSGGVFKRGIEYQITCYSTFGMDKYYYVEGVDFKCVVDGKYVTFTFVPSRDILSNQLQFCVYKGSGSGLVQGAFYYSSSSSSYIPASDTGQQGQTTAANTTVIKNVVTNISNTVSNISNQITNTTNTITNTITNTTNQIKEAVNQSANQISQTVTNTSNQIKESVNQSAEKISQTVTNKVNEVNGTINSVGQKTQEKIDDTKKAVVDKLEDTKTGIITGIIDGLKSLFIPSDDFFKTWFDDMYSFFDERLGFLMLPVDLLVNLIDMVVSADSSNAGIPFPEIKWEGTVLIPAQTVKIEIFDTDFGKELQDKLYFVGNVIMIGALLSLMHRKIEEVLRS